MKVIISIAILVFGLLLMWFATPAKALGMCGQRADFIRALSDKYFEVPKALAIAGQVNLVEVFKSRAGTWTILVTTPEGKTCIIAAGNSWEDVPEQVLGDNS